MIFVRLEIYLEVIYRVFTTSKGHVKNAARVPEQHPDTEHTNAYSLPLFSMILNGFFHLSNKGIWVAEKSTSLRSVGE